MPKKRPAPKNVLSKVEKQTGHTAKEWLQVFAELAVTELEGVEPELARIFRRGQQLLNQMRSNRVVDALPAKTPRKRTKRRAAPRKKASARTPATLRPSTRPPA